MPVLFAARDGSAVGAAHAGWRGLAGGVLEETVRHLGAAAQLVAWLGPTIGQQHFEVGDEVRAAFVSHDPDAASAFESNARGRWQCDLYSLARRRLSGLGVRSNLRWWLVHLCGCGAIFLVSARWPVRSHGGAHLARTIIGTWKCPAAA